MIIASTPSWEDLEGIALDVLDTTGIDAPVDAISLARSLGLRVHWRVGGSALDHRARIVFVDRHRIKRDLHMDVAHECGHFLQLELGLANLERGAKYLGGALLLPRRRYDRDLSRRGWSIATLREVHPNAPSLALAIRIAQLRDAIITIVDPVGRLRPWRYSSPWLDLERVGPITRTEHDLATQAFADGAEIASNDLHATPVFDEYDGPRVIVTRDLRKLGLHFVT